MGFQKLKKTTEIIWSNKKLDKNILGFQVQPGTRWRQGLSQDKITELTSNIPYSLPEEVIEFYSMMDGLDRDLVDVHGMDGRPATYSKYIFSLVGDIEHIKSLIETSNEVSLSDIDGDGCQLISAPVKLFPFAEGMYVVCPPNPALVISKEENEFMVVSKDLLSYLNIILRK